MRKSFLCSVFLFTITSFQAQQTETEVVPESDPNQEVSIYILYDEAPQFEACKGVEKYQQSNCFSENINLHIRENLVILQEAHDKKLSGRVLISFTIEINGMVTNIYCRGESLLCKEAERIMRLLPALKPGKLRGKVTAIKYSIPISFDID
jgi:protein TonB